MIVAVANRKGGTSCTTTAVYLAELASSSAPTLVVDADPQASALAWLGGLEAAGPEVVALPLETVGQQIPSVARGFEHVFIDTPPGHTEIIFSAMQAADVTLVPMTPTGLEVVRLRPTLELSAEAGTPAVVLLVRCRPTRSVREVLDVLLDQQIAVLAAMIPLREQIATSFGRVPRAFFGYDVAWESLVTAMADGLGRPVTSSS